MKITKVEKRDGEIVSFDQPKITNAIFKAITAVGQGDDKLSQKLSDKVVRLLERRFKKGQIPKVEEIQDTVEEVLILEDLVEVARAYILYRERRRQIRERTRSTKEAVEMIDGYIKETDWQVKENANMAYSLQGLNHYAVSAISKKYWLNKIYPEQIREKVESGDYHIHDLDTLGCYCAGWSLQDLLLRGFGGVSGKVESKPAKHLRTALGQLVNFFFTLQGEVAGAVAMSSFDTLLAPFIHYDNLNYQQVKQALQEFLFNMAVPTRVGFQTPFSNLTLDLKPPEGLKNQPIVIGGQLREKTYGDFQEEMDIFNRALYELYIEGDAKGRPFTFPIPTVSITKNFDWDNPAFGPMWEATAKLGTNYFSNFVNSDMKPEDIRSMCCRLNIDKRELYKRGGGLFGAAELTGSIGVVTLNMPRIGYLSKSKKEFFNRLTELMDSAKETLEIKRKALENFITIGLYPYSRHYLSGVKKARGAYYGNHFSTIGLVGMNEALLNFMGENIASKKGREFTLEVLDFMRERMVKYQKETGNLYNLEATPAESTAYRLAKKDKEKYPDIITAGKKQPYYTNSTMLPVGYTDDIFEALKLQDEIQCKYTGGVVMHLFLGERISDTQNLKNLLKKIFENFHLPYLTFTPTFSICPEHGYISGEHFNCPQCLIKQPCEVYSRVVGYYRPVSQFNIGKQEEFHQRKVFKIKKGK